MGAQDPPRPCLTGPAEGTGRVPQVNPGQLLQAGGTQAVSMKAVRPLGQGVTPACFISLGVPRVTSDSLPARHFSCPVFPTCMF